MPRAVFVAPGDPVQVIRQSVQGVWGRLNLPPKAPPSTGIDPVLFLYDFEQSLELAGGSPSAIRPLVDASDGALQLELKPY